MQPHIKRSWESKPNFEWSGIDPLILARVYELGHIDGDDYRENKIASDEDYLRELLERFNKRSE